MSNAPVLEVRRVPNPSFGQELLDAIDRGEITNIPRHIDAPHNLTLLVGALARMKGVGRAQLEAAAHYRSSWEGGLIGGARAIDYGVPRVDTSLKSVSVLLEHGAAERFDYSRAVQRLGMLNARLLELVVCEGRSVREVAAKLGYGDSRSKREELRKRLLQALDLLVREFGIGGAGRRIRGEGDRPAVSDCDVAIQRKRAGQP